MGTREGRVELRERIGGYIVVGMIEDVSAPDGAPGELVGIDDGDQEDDGSATDHVGSAFAGDARRTHWLGGTP